MHISNNPFIGKTEISFVTHYDVIKHLDVKISCNFFDFRSKFLISTAGLKVSGRVVMTKDNIDRIFFQCLFEYYSRIGDCSGNTSLADDLKMIDLIGSIQENHRKYFPAMVLQHGLEV